MKITQAVAMSDYLYKSHGTIVATSYSPKLERYFVFEPHIATACVILSVITDSYCLCDCIIIKVTNSAARMILELITNSYSRCDYITIAALTGGEGMPREPCTAPLRYSVGTRAAHPLPGHGNPAAGARWVLSARVLTWVGGPQRGTPRLSLLHRCGTRRRTLARTREAEGRRLDRRVLGGYSRVLGHRVGRRRGRRRSRAVPPRPVQHSFAARCDGNASRVATQLRVVATPDR